MLTGNFKSRWRADRIFASDKSSDKKETKNKLGNLM